MAIFWITNKRTYLTFLTIFLLTMPNATAKTIGLVIGIGQLVGFLVEIPSGYVADRIGHKSALVIARVSMVLSTACYVFADSVGWFFAGGILLAIGFAFASGTASAFIHDTLRDLGKDDQFARVVGNLRSIGFAVPIIFIIGLPIIAEVSFRWAFIAALVIDIIGLIVTLSLVSPESSSGVEEVSIANFKKKFSEWYNAGWVRYVIVAMVVGGISFGASAGFKNPYQEMVGFSVSSLGILWAISRGLISAMLLGNGWIYKTFTYKQFTIIRSLVPVLCFFAVGLVGNMWVIAAAFILLTAMGFGTSSAQSQYNFDFIKNSKSKATLLSINNLIKQFVSGAFGLVMGFLVAGYSFSIAFAITGTILVIVTGIAVYWLPEE